MAIMNDGRIVSYGTMGGEGNLKRKQQYFLDMHFMGLICRELFLPPDGYWAKLGVTIPQA